MFPVVNLKVSEYKRLLDSESSVLRDYLSLSRILPEMIVRCLQVVP